jgi:cytochrome c-type biogenesis protein CcmE
VARTTRSPARLIVALAVAAVLAVFLLYTALAGNATPTLRPSQLAADHPSKVAVEGTVVGPLRGDSHSAAGLRFSMKDIGKQAGTVAIVYHGDSPPPLFAVGRNVIVSGSYVNGRIQGTDIVTKCPSKYVPSTSSKS